MFIYMAVTADQYELPLAIADSFADLAKILGIEKTTVWRLSKEDRATNYKYCGRYYKVKKVELEKVQE